MVSNSEPLPEGTVIMADDQFAGRGQQNNVWHSRAGLNLTFSIFLRPFFLLPSNQFMLNIAVSTAINKALELFLPEGVKVKWPNDIFFGDRKLGGVLIENSLQGNLIKTSIIGIGINVNQRDFNVKKVGAAISMCEILQQDVDLVKLLSEICLQMEQQYFLLKACNYDVLFREYLDRLYRFEQKALYKDDNGIFEGKIVDVSSNGQLTIAAGGQNRNYNFKEVEFIF